MDNPVIIFGANYLGRAAKDIFEGNGNVVYGFLDDNKKLHQTEIDNVVVIGSTDDDGFLKLIGKKCEAFVATDDNKIRRTLVKMIQDERKMQPTNAIHKSSIMAASSSLGHGNLIDQGVKIGAGATLGNHGVLQPGVIIGPEATLGDFVQVGAGTIINSGSVIEDDVFIGSGVTIISGIIIGKGARVGAGSVVISPVKPGETVFGNPAQKISNS
jgi:sugar O-acyltransferase (sialic acid O-acetyltransferase NeuD family)